MHRRDRRHHLALCVMAVCLTAAAWASADVVELLNGTRVEGRIVSGAAEAVTVKVRMGDASAEMRFPLAKVHAITANGQRRVVNEKTGRKPATPKPSTPGGGKQPGTSPTGGRVTRSRAEAEALIQKAGTAPPDWWDSVPLEYPKTLDLSWPEKPQGPWNASKNVGQYLWSAINENPRRWRSGVRFLHHMLTVHKDDAGKLGKVMNSLASSYFKLLDDPARAAFWWRMARKRKTPHVGDTIHLAECYWKLGSKAMATAEMAKVRRYLTPAAVKLWADMGELRRACSMADKMVGTRLAPYGLTVAGDVCRQHGRYREAIAYYQKVLRIPATGKQKKHMDTMHARARASIDAIKVLDDLDLTRVPDGTHSATVMAYAGPITVDVVVAGGRIEAVKPRNCQDKQYYGSLTEIPKRIVERQSLKGIDAVSQATITSQAIINAAAKALADAMR